MRLCCVFDVRWMSGSFDVWLAGFGGLWETIVEWEDGDTEWSFMR